MVRLAVFSLYLWSLIASDAVADPQQVLRSYIQSSKEIFLADVTAISGHEITFSVSKKIKGSDSKTFKLLDVEKPPVDKAYQGFPLHSEWLLVSTGSNEKTVRWARGGTTDWVAAWIQLSDKRYKAVDGGFLSGEQGNSILLTLQQVGELASTPVPNH